MCFHSLNLPQIMIFPYFNQCFCCRRIQTDCGVFLLYILFPFFIFHLVFIVPIFLCLLIFILILLFKFPSFLCNLFTYLSFIVFYWCFLLFLCPRFFSFLCICRFTLLLAPSSTFFIVGYKHMFRLLFCSLLYFQIKVLLYFVDQTLFSRMFTAEGFVSSVNLTGTRG